MTIYKPFSVVDIPFPFVDSIGQKRRPALVLSDTSFQTANGAVVLAMITSAERSSWSGDIPLRDWQVAGLKKPSILRWKIFTLDASLVAGLRSTLSEYDQSLVRNGFEAHFAALLGVTTK